MLRITAHVLVAGLVPPSLSESRVHTSVTVLSGTSLPFLERIVITCEKGGGEERKGKA